MQWIGHSKNLKSHAYFKKFWGNFEVPMKLQYLNRPYSPRGHEFKCYRLNLGKVFIEENIRMLWILNAYNGKFICHYRPQRGKKTFLISFDLLIKIPEQSVWDAQNRSFNYWQGNGLSLIRVNTWSDIWQVETGSVHEEVEEEKNDLNTF